MAYITAAEYEQITGRDRLEATDARLQRASMLLDARIGNYPVLASGWKLDLLNLPVHQVNAVKEWVAQMVAFLYENSDIAPSSASVSLGRFSVTEHGQKGTLIPESLGFADAALIAAGLIRRGVKVI
jgi:hypothetical protein